MSDGVLKKFISPRRQHTIITMTINEHAKTDMYMEHYIQESQLKQSLADRTAQ